MNEVVQRRIDVSQPSSRHQVVYLMVNADDKTVAVFGFEEIAKKSLLAGSCKIIPEAVDLTEIARKASDKLDALERYAITRKGIQE